MEHTVYFRRQPDYDQQAMDQAVEAFCGQPRRRPAQGRHAGDHQTQSAGQTRPRKGVTTHPALVRAVIQAVKRRGVSDITVADSPGAFIPPPL